MLALRKNKKLTLLRKEFKTEWDFEWTRGQLRFNRIASEGRSRHEYENHIQIQSTKSVVRHPSSTVLAALELVKQFTHTYDKVRFTWIHEDKEIKGKYKAAFKTETLYVRIDIGDYFSAKLFTLTSSTQDDLRNWERGFRNYLQLPNLKTDIKFETVVLSPEAFGYLLHEGVGHRLEGDDFQETIFWKIFRPTNFSIYDIPGNPGWPGYCPVDDSGQKGRKIRLFDGKTGKQTLLSKGNMRAINCQWHPIVRQRTLTAKTNRTGKLPKAKNVLFIKSIQDGNFDGSICSLFTREQTVTSNGKTYRLPPLTLQFKPTILTQLTTFGDIEVHHPPGGCHKDLQRGLGITFVVPSAFTKPSSFLSIAQFTP